MPRDFCDAPSNTKPYFAEVLTPSPRLDDQPLRSAREYYDTPAEAIAHVERFMRNHGDVVRAEIYRAGPTADSHHTRIEIIHQSDLVHHDFEADDLEAIMQGDMDDTPAMHY